MCACGFLLTWAGQRRSFRSLVSPISGADLKGQLTMSQEYVWLCRTVMIKSGKKICWWTQHMVYNSPCRVSCYTFLAVDLAGIQGLNTPPTFNFYRLLLRKWFCKRKCKFISYALAISFCCCGILLLGWFIVLPCRISLAIKAIWAQESNPGFFYA